MPHGRTEGRLCFARAGGTAELITGKLEGYMYVISSIAVCMCSVNRDRMLLHFKAAEVYKFNEPKVLAAQARGLAARQEREC